ncbi:SDR family oxidoreductase [Estrella lausannensis]|uniref:Short-chain dehydrogenase/reductase n=1 Tax=Estrella lausannensis TaxID=483423 RepID=A0A0H5DPZ3_9BACT|nr:SDR family oxidoreductase [Estrella lausannensis]CRX38686.1 Short-chain dehydrogenase/reductase [Estrella lausannensis]
MPKILLSLLISVLSFDLAAKEVVLVTGASRGIGHAIAEYLAEEGYRVYAGVRKASPTHLAEAALQKHSSNYFPIELDVQDENSVAKAIEHVFMKEGRLDVLVNNAGIMVYGSLENVTVEEVEKVFDVNFLGPIRMAQAVLPIMRGQKSGKIIQISSRSGFRPLPSLSVYAASKFALEGLSETMAATLAPWNIHVSLVEPGPVNTDLDFLSPYGSRLARDNDPFYPMFEGAGLLDPVSPIVQQPMEIARLVMEIIESEKPHLRYQTTPLIERQAASRFVDPTGDSSLAEWKNAFNW